MEIARLVLDYIKVMIWPATTIAIVYGFRTQLSALIRRVRMLSAPGIDAEFSEEVIEASEDAEAAVLTNEPASGDEDTRREPVDSQQDQSGTTADRPLVRPHLRHDATSDLLLAYAETQPESAIVAAWWHVEAELRRLGESDLGRAQRGPLPLSRLLDRLNLPQDISASLMELRQVRNRAAHARSQHLSPRAALAYVRSCREMIEWLEARGQQQPLF